MRAFILLMWLVLFGFYWQYHDRFCDTGTDDLVPIQAMEPLSPLAKKLNPIKFLCSEAKPDLKPRWEQFRDSLVNALGKDDLLQIKGLYYEDEVYNGEGDLGLARAKNVLKLFDNLAEDRIRITSQSKGDSCLRNEINNMITFRFLKNTTKIKEIDDRTLIYFPFNSTDKLADAEVEAYLDEVFERIERSGERIKLTGHTDDSGTDDYNLQLGERRATIISDYFIRKGLSPSKVIIDSKGERAPYKSNDTEDGQALNRRTELQIVD